MGRSLLYLPTTSIPQIHHHTHCMRSSQRVPSCSATDRPFTFAVAAADMSSLRAWVAEHKLSSISALWASGVGASLAYTGRKSPIKTSLRLIHARMHAQALTLAVLSSAALLHYYESKHDDVENVGRNTVA